MYHVQDEHFVNHVHEVTFFNSRSKQSVTDFFFGETNEKLLICLHHLHV